MTHDPKEQESRIVDFHRVLKEQGASPQALAMLEETPALLSARGEDGQTAIHYAVERRDPELVDLLLARGADINGRDDRGWSPLYGLMIGGGIEMCRHLLARGALVDQRDLHDSTPMHPAAMFLTTAYLELLVEHGADVNARDSAGWLPIHSALRDNSIDTARWLWEHGSLRDVCSAAGLGEIAFLRECVRVDKNCLNARGPGETPVLHWAFLCNQVRAASYLLHNGCRVDDRGRYQETALHLIAIRTRRLEMVQLLIEHGADVNAQDRAGRTPLSYAIRRNCGAVIDLLRAHGARETSPHG